MMHLMTYESRTKWYKDGKLYHDTDSFDDDNLFNDEIKSITFKDCINTEYDEKVKDVMKCIKIRISDWEILCEYLHKIGARWGSGHIPSKFKPVNQYGYYFISIYYDNRMLKIYHYSFASSSKVVIFNYEDIDFNANEAAATVKWYKDGKLEIDEKEYSELPAHDIIFNEDFTNFLIENGAYENFLKETLKYKKLKNLEELNTYLRLKHKNNAFPTNIIDNSMLWADTQQKDAYWSKLDDMWKNKCKVLRGGIL